MMNMNNTTSYNTTRTHLIEEEKVATITAFILFLIASTLVGNFLVLLTIYSTPRLRFSAFFFVASLATSDFLVGVVVLPISLAYHLSHEIYGQWIFGSLTCKAWLLANFWFLSASVINLCLISWDRYVAVTSSLLYKQRMSDNRVRCKITASWGASLGMGLMVTAGLQEPSVKKPNCNVLSSHVVVTALGVVLVFVIPVFFLIFVNSRILIAARKHAKRIHQRALDTSHLATMASSLRSTTQQAFSEKPSRAILLKRTFKQEIKTFKTFLVVIGVFVVCWTPFFTMLMISLDRPISSGVFYVAILLTYCNSAMNVIIYSVFSRDFRRALIKSIQFT